MSLEKALPPIAPRYRSILRLQRFMKNPIPFMKENIAKYGETYCFSLRYNNVNILTVDPDIIQHILRKNEANYVKPESSSSALGRFIGKGLLLATGEEHKEQRKLIAPGFRPKSLTKLVTLMDEQIETYFEELDTRVGNGPITIDDEMRLLTFQVMCKAIYGSDMNKEKVDAFYNRFQTLQEFLIKLVRIPGLMKFYDFTGKTKYYEQVSKDNNEAILKIIQERRKTEPKDDLLGMLMACKYENSDDGMTDAKLQEESLVLFVAGHETASNILSWIFYLLKKHPETIVKIKAEADEMLQGKTPTFEQLIRMEYLGRVLDECLRMYPPSWITDRIAVEDDTIKGFHIPKGARVIPFIYGLHHSEKLWPDHDKFDPDRFTKAHRKERHNFAHMPFGAGPRQCIGRNMATMEMKMIILKLIDRYDFDLVKNQKIAMWPAVTLKPRYGIKFNFSMKNS